MQRKLLQQEVDCRRIVKLSALAACWPLVDTPFGKSQTLDKFEAETVSGQ